MVKVEKVFVSKSETFLNVDNVIRNDCDVFLTTKEKAETWKSSKFRQNIFSKFYFWYNFRSFDEITKNKFNFKCHPEANFLKFVYFSARECSI